MEGNNNFELEKRIEKLESENKQLNSQISLLNQIISLLPISVFAKNVQDDYRYILWNKELEKVFGISNEKIIGITDYDLFENKAESDYFRNYDVSVMNGGEIVDIPEEDLTTALGKIIVHTRKIPIFDNEGKPQILLGCLEDITARKTTENQLKKTTEELSELNKTKDKFLSILAHDVKNSMNVIQGFSELVSESLKNQGATKDLRYVEMIHSASLLTNNLLENLLVWVRSQHNTLGFYPETIELDAFIEEMLEDYKQFAHNKLIKLIHPKKNSIKVTADRNMLHTVFRNLLNNAIKFTNKGGKIELSTEIYEKHTEISVIDNGVGLLPDDAAKLFFKEERKTMPGTENERGSGLGLLLCKEFIERHGGQIWVESEYGKGSSFKFTIPLVVNGKK